MTTDEEPQSPPLPKDLEDLLDRVRESRRSLDETLEQVVEARMVATKDDEWSVKDHVAHLSTWERMLTAHLVDGTDHEVVAMGKEEYAAAELETLNTQIHRLTKEWTLGRVMTEWEESYSELREVLYKLTEDDLREPYWTDDPTGRSTMEKVAGDTYLHYAEHEAWIRRLAGLK